VRAFNDFFEVVGSIDFDDDDTTDDTSADDASADDTSTDDIFFEDDDTFDDDFGPGLLVESLESSIDLICMRVGESFCMPQLAESGIF